MSDSDKEQPVNMFCLFVTDEILYSIERGRAMAQYCKHVMEHNLNRYDGIQCQTSKHSYENLKLYFGLIDGNINQS
jgi:hypothetical protein